ncbi:hypothetical protein EHI8A_027470 [Entamoeba histolytica HM-1:IMSS-B]|uniref:Uncharacterized protein n=7 Tax=Entamoeba TaxID=5758 RepID=C4LYB0_ENTH1|nr:hypothetical protein ENU1_007750 [Entamoeba nuttalli P19]XP_654780.2 hypothetical protein EHI_167100 [Entamoeba histolytica HM-1:IMSS]EMD44457.1 Hypothetical protein EHI5A_054280 [Entamoeba histolytica KU27]EMH74215.1 hypothetical protein EHI8A_027470 [Entamoeba histolytica HM-1:IMSS-B]EMS15820.1 hypothetical protein KM1_065320 [Entamoeba histolytica HM-3:IMSS]ENY65538.1 hypothetical protein EHI7A_030590 [Entamoeba histolytica HM-1:IMSS-A]GAT93797.1 hypothetical protein CL6EHI_167100 [Enta|eukprot:XP_008854808.1 hypothetical protein ENU1_007750 [Entamoeba nuttalli P19]
MARLLDVTKLTISVPSASPHFPAMMVAVEQWNSVNSAIRIIIENIPPSISHAELLGLLYRFSGTLGKYAKKLESFAATPIQWNDIKSNYNQYIEYYSQKIPENTSVNPEQFVFNLARNKLGEALQQKEECKMNQQPVNDIIKRLFFQCDDLFKLLLEWCDREEESTMVLKFIELIQEVISGF